MNRILENTLSWDELSQVLGGAVKGGAAHERRVMCACRRMVLTQAELFVLSAWVIPTPNSSPNFHIQSLYCLAKPWAESLYVSHSLTQVNEWVYSTLWLHLFEFKPEE